MPYRNDELLVSICLLSLAGPYYIANFLLVAHICNAGNVLPDQLATYTIPITCHLCSSTSLHACKHRTFAACSQLEKQYTITHKRMPRTGEASLSHSKLMQRIRSSLEEVFRVKVQYN